MVRFLAISIFTLLLTGCSNIYKISEDRIPQEVSEYAKNFLDELVSGNINYCISQMDTRFQNDNVKGSFEEAYENLKDKELKNYVVIDYGSTTIYNDNPISNYGLVYEYEYNDMWIYYTFQLEEKDGLFTILAFDISPYEYSLRQASQFTFKGKGLLHYFFCLMAITVPLFILFSVGFCIKTPVNLKWLWVIFILFGFISFTLNWTDGQFRLKLINLEFLGASFSRISLVDPWIISFSIPIGAIFFWFKRAQLISAQRRQEIEAIGREEGDAH